MKSNRKVWLITAASSGIGKALSQAVIARGDIAVLTDCHRDRLQDIARGNDKHALALSMDITNAASRDCAVTAALMRFGRIDVLANIAGPSVAHDGQESTSHQLREQMESTFFAPVELTRSVLPWMRQQGSGHILTLTSIAERVSMNTAGSYCASKFALEGWTQALAAEVAAMGIRVTMVEPGALRNEFSDGPTMRAAPRIEAHMPMVAPVEEHLQICAGKHTGDPAKAAQQMLDVVDSNAPPARLVLGRNAFSIWDATVDPRVQELAVRCAGIEDTTFDDAETVYLQP